MSGDGPSICTVLPVLNEAEYIVACLDSLMDQSIDSSDHMILVLDGGSTDSTATLVRDAISRSKERGGPHIELHDNPGKYVAEARNLALTLLPPSVRYCVELIGHSTVEANHLELRIAEWKRVEAIDSSPLAALGVRVEPRKGEHGFVEGWVEACLSSPFGSGSGQFSSFKEDGATQTPAFAMHLRTALEAVGGWDTSFITSQDSDLSMRLIEQGYRLHRTPSTSVSMTKRTGIVKWWRMGHRYGFWRMKVVRRHPQRASAIEFLPWIGALLSLIMAFTLPSFGWVLPTMYGAVLMLEGIRSTFQTRRMTNILGVPLCLIMLHSSFSIGLLDGLLRDGRAPSDR